MTEPASSDEFLYLAKPLPPAPERRPRGGRRSDVPRTAIRAAFAVAVAAMAYLSLRMIRSSSFGSMLVTLGVVVGVWWMLDRRGGVLDRMQSRRVADQLKRHPDGPWLVDHPWDSSGESARPFLRLLPESPVGRRFLLVACYWTGVVAPHFGSWIAWTPGGFVATWLAWRAWRLHGAGVGRVSYAKFPFHPGESVTLYFGMSEGGATFERASFHLQRVNEIPGGPFGRMRFAVATRGINIHRPPGVLPGPGEDVKLVFDVPRAAGGTRLSAPLPQYWVLDVVANTSAGPYCASFLVPIYERPAEDAT